jgi:YgiT-type zinc finger domain-containing protein
MKCSLEGCPGTYEDRLILHTVRHRGDVVVIENVSAEVCSICADVLFRPETVRRIEKLLEARSKPSRTVPLYEYA